jgi:predicted Rossmann-fold nucleotide-binding protein
MEAGRRVLEIPGGLPYDPFRTTLYTPEELSEDGLDARIERHVAEHGFRSPPTEEALAQRLHDHAMDQALAELLCSVDRARVVAVMGSAVTPRDDRWYRAGAELGRLLARAGYVVATGGGPGMMEAANLGAALAGHDDDLLDEVLEQLEAVPSYERDPAAYAAASIDVRGRLGERSPSLAIPTWFYPREPVGQFATHVAKYFANSIREDGLLTIALSGIVFAPGRAGTTQELFQDAAQNAYGTHGRSPMVLLGREAYDSEPSLYAVLRDQARRYGGYEHMVTLCDEPEDALAFIRDHEPREAVEALDGSAEDILSFMRNERSRAR